MPILTIDVIEDRDCALPHGAARRIADAAGAVLGTAAGRTWAILRCIPAGDYAENQVAEAPAPLFVNLRLRQPPEGAERALQVQALTHAIAEAVGRSAEQVHIRYEPAAAGNQAISGRLV